MEQLGWRDRTMVARYAKATAGRRAASMVERLDPLRKR
jgi:hypothetical protein